MALREDMFAPFDVARAAANAAEWRINYVALGICHRQNGSIGNRITFHRFELNNLIQCMCGPHDIVQPLKRVCPLPLQEPANMDASLVPTDDERHHAQAAPSMTTIPPRQKEKVKRTTLSLHEKSIVKTFCEQQLNECKTRADYVPSHDVLRQEISTKFGWEVGRSTLSKIMSMEWDQLQLDGHPNPTMKRKRKPLFPLFEDDLIKSIHAFLQQAPLTGDGDDSGKGGSPMLTEAIILEEAQRLKQLHGIKDEELVLSVGWLARFKHRNGIRLRKATTVRADVMPSSTVLSLPDEELPNKRYRGAAAFDVSDEFTFHLQTSSALPLRPVGHSNDQSLQLIAALSDLRSICASRDVATTVDSVPSSIVDGLPIDIRSCCCSHCSVSMPVEIQGLHITVAGYNCVRDAFIAAALVGEHGSVTCIETNAEAATVAEQHSETYTTKVLGYAVSNLHIVRPSLVAHSHLLNSRDIVLFNCSFLSSVHKTLLIEWAFNVLKEGGECRVCYVSSRRRITQLSQPSLPAVTDCDLLPPERLQELIAASMYMEDFRRMCQHLGFLDPRCLSAVPVTGAAELGLTVATYRLFKLRLVEDRREDYGERAMFTASSSSGDDDNAFRLDSQWAFLPKRSVPVDGNTAQILRLSWVKRMFDVHGDRSVHRGRFIDPSSELSDPC